MNINDRSDEEILEIAHPMWDELIKYSNKGQYGKFIRSFPMTAARFERVELGKQFAHSDLSRNLVEERDFLGLIRRGEHVTCSLSRTEHDQGRRVAGKNGARLREGRGAYFRRIDFLVHERQVARNKYVELK